MSAGQTIATCVTSAIPRLVSLFSLCTAGFEEFDEIEIDKQMKIQYIYIIINCIFLIDLNKQQYVNTSKL